MATRWPPPVQLWGGTVALSLVVVFWVTAFLVSQAFGPVAHPLLDVIFLAYFVISPLLGFLTLFLLRRAVRVGIQSRTRVPAQAWLAFAALAGWVIGLGFLDLR